MRRVILMMLLAVVSSTAMTAHSEVLRCVCTTLGGLEFTLDIVVPEDFNLTLTTTDKKGRFNSMIYGDSLVSIGEGVIEVKMLSQQAKRFPFVVTRRPTEMNSLTGFYIEDGTPIIVKIDPRVVGKPLLLYDPLFYPEAPVLGKCT
jgi:hypothetical protein